MKKVIFTVSALVCLALSAMFVSCNEAVNGCTCRLTFTGQGTETATFDLAQMKEQFAVSSCSALATSLKDYFEKQEYVVASSVCTSY